MESQVNVGANLRRRWSVFGLSCSLLGVLGGGHAQEQSKASGGTTEMSLRKSVITRQFQGREFAGEEREIARGESLWRILVEEKRLSDRQFHSYLIIIRGLNPQIKTLDVLRVGDRRVVEDVVAVVVEVELAAELGVALPVPGGNAHLAAI